MACRSSFWRHRRAHATAPWPGVCRPQRGHSRAPIRKTVRMGRELRAARMEVACLMSVDTVVGRKLVSKLNYQSPRVQGPQSGIATEPKPRRAARGRDGRTERPRPPAADAEHERTVAT